jgi:DNA-directed RNA polymerase specialized sigma24 family protein
MPPHEPFDSTHWSVILAARDRNSSEARAALGELCRAYWYPLYAFIRHRGHDHQTAEDLTQMFFTRLLESNDLAHVDRSKGRFRAFLLAACNHFLANQRDRRQARKRGGDRTFLSIDQAAAQRSYDLEPAHWLTAEALFARRWAILLLDQTIEDLQAEFSRTGQSERFEALKPTLTGDHVPYTELSARLNITVGAVQVAVHRLRQRYRAALRARIGATVGDPSQIDDEIRELFAALAS